MLSSAETNKAIKSPHLMLEEAGLVLLSRASTHVAARHNVLTQQLGPGLGLRSVGLLVLSKC